MDDNDTAFGFGAAPSPGRHGLCVRQQALFAQYWGTADMCRWAFSIWGIIFLLQGVGVVYQWLPQGYGNDGWKARIINSIGARGCRVWRLLRSSYMASHNLRAVPYFVALGQQRNRWT